MSDGRRVGWIISLPRCGTSATAYSCAAPFGAPVADEVFMWDRTAPPFGYPPEQRALFEAFTGAERVLTPEVVRLAEDVFARIAGDSPLVVSKSPYLVPTETDIAWMMPTHRVAMILRNPLHRVASYIRLRMEFLDWAGPFELEIFKSFARRWLAHPCRVVYEDLRRDPSGYFRRIFEGWEIEFGEEHVTRAVEYQAGHYHAWCDKVTRHSTAKVLSEHEYSPPDAAIEAYLGDPFVRDLMSEVGWSTDPATYRGRSTEPPPRLKRVAQG